MSEQHMLVNNKINFLQAIRRYLASYIDSWVGFFAILSSIFAIAIIPAFIIAKKYNIDLSYYLSNDVIKHSFSPDVIDQFVISNWKIILIGFVVAMITWFILDILFRTLMLYWFDNTLGKMLFSLQILSTDNSPLTSKDYGNENLRKVYSQHYGL